MPPRRPVEEAALDPWAEQMRINAQRELEVAQAEIEDKRIKATRRHDRWGIFGVWVGCLTGLGIIVGGVYAIVTHFDVDEEERARLRIAEAEARAEGVRACLTLEEPAERQLCVISLGLPEQEPETEDG